MTSLFISLAIYNGITIGIVVALLVTLCLLILSAVVSGSETAAFSLSPADLNVIKNDKSKNYATVLQILETPKRLLATILIVNNFVNVAIVMLSTYIIHHVFDFSIYPALGFLIEVGIVTSLILLAGEIIPKVYATNYALKTISSFAPFIRFLMRVTYPFAMILTKSTSFVDKRIARKSYNISIHELSDVIDIATQKDSGVQESSILKGIVNFGDISVSEIMRSRTDVTAVDVADSFGVLMKTILDAGYSRMPVYKNTFDQIEGMLYIKDLLPFLREGNQFNWQSLIRPAFFVPENKKIDNLLNEFQEKKIHMAVVVDEYGGTSGIVTLEDIMEEILGEISDEFDSVNDDLFYRQIKDNVFIFDGKFSLVDFCKIMKIDSDVFDPIKGEAETLAGLILEKTGKFPQQQEIIQILPFVFKIEAMDKRRIKRIRVEKIS